MKNEINIKRGIQIACLIVPFLVIIYILFSGHVLKEIDGNLFGGQSTYGDLSMHLGMITSLAKQGVFPPDYSILPGTKLCYPFLVNLQSSAIYLFGATLRTSIILPSMVMSLSCLLGLYALAKEFCKKKGAAYLAVCLFFITGGLGFFYYLDGEGMLRTLFTEYYMAPTNCLQFNLRWVNVICDMMIPQRTFLIGLSTVLPILLLIKKSLDANNNYHLLLAGIMASAMPMIHTHSFLALGIICAGLLLGGIIIKEYPLKEWIKKWLLFLVPVIVLATPQLLFWIFTQSEGFLRINLDWVNTTDTWLWFWIKNIGIVFILIIPAFINANKKMRVWYISATIIYIIAEVVAFQPNEYDNNKLMLVWYVFTCILVSDYLMYLYESISKVNDKKYIAFIICILLFTSGSLTIGRELYSNKQYMQYANYQVDCANVVDASTPSDALFITGTQHLNEISALAGRNIYAGSTLYVHFHGLDYYSRHEELRAIYSDAASAADILAKINADYIYISSYERNNYDVDETLYFFYPIVYSNRGLEILAVSDRAKDIGLLDIT